jgi:hypothetical protein
MSLNRHTKQFVAALTLLGAASVPSHAQRIGLMAGVTFANISGEKDIKLDNRTGTFLGVSLQAPLGSSLAFQPELVFLNKGAKFSLIDGTSTNSGSVRLDYVEVPLLLRYDFARSFVGPHLYAGPSIGFNVGCAVNYASGPSSGSRDCTNNDFKPKSLDYGLIGGGGVDFNLGGISATGGLRYEIGLADIRSDNSSTFKDRVHNGVLSIYVGIALGKLGK